MPIDERIGCRLVARCCNGAVKTCICCKRVGRPCSAYVTQLRPRHEGYGRSTTLCFSLGSMVQAPCAGITDSLTSRSMGMVSVTIRFAKRGAKTSLCFHFDCDCRHNESMTKHPATNAKRVGGGNVLGLGMFSISCGN